MAKDPAFWSFNSGAVSKVSNQFAAMPSVHCAWALWSTCTLGAAACKRPGWAKALAVVYPITTVTVIVVTADHYFLDAVAGFFVLGVGYVAARIFAAHGRRRHRSRRSHRSPQSPADRRSVVRAVRQVSHG